MGRYFIKLIYGPAAQTEKYPQEVIHFAKGQLSRMCAFVKCDGFLLYETSREGGAKKIYGYGTVKPNQKGTVDKRVVDGKEFEYGIFVNVEHVVHPTDGIPVERIRQVIRKTNIQSPGGMLEITKDQYDKLLEELVRKKKV